MTLIAPAPNAFFGFGAVNSYADSTISEGSGSPWFEFADRIVDFCFSLKIWMQFLAQLSIATRSLLHLDISSDLLYARLSYQDQDVVYIQL